MPARTGAGVLDALKLCGVALPLSCLAFLGVWLAGGWGLDTWWVLLLPWGQTAVPMAFLIVAARVCGAVVGTAVDVVTLPPIRVAGGADGGEGDISFVADGGQLSEHGAGALTEAGAPRAPSRLNPSW